MYKSYLDRYCENIEAAREKVEQAQHAYSRGGSLAALNKAHRELADCHDEYRSCYGLRVHDTRGAPQRRG
jgi:hypothetical protein